MDADRWSGEKDGGWPCYVANCGGGGGGMSVSYVDESSATNPSSALCWLTSQSAELTTCSVCAVCRPSYVNVTTTQSSSSSSQSALLKPAATAAAAEDLGKQTYDHTGLKTELVKTQGFFTKSFLGFLGFLKVLGVLNQLTSAVAGQCTKLRQAKIRPCERHKS